MREELLQVSNLKVGFKTSKDFLTAVRGISFSVNKGETLCIVGESGCGKSITALSLMGLLPDNGEISTGNVLLNNKDLTTISKEALRKIRGNAISMIFQEPMTALNPVFTIGFQLREPLMVHKGLSKAEAHNKGIELLHQVGLPLPEQRMKQFPHELSGGMRQRVMIAMALACEPQMLIADEPTTALDVTIQAQILDLIEEIKQRMNMGVILITHDMGVVAEMADRVLVMYAGEVVEEGDVETIFHNPSHPYTKGLLDSVPNAESDHFEIEAIPGTMPALHEQISGCRFHPRCSYATDRCKSEVPPAFDVTSEQKSRCWLQEAGYEQRYSL